MNAVAWFYSGQFFALLSTLAAYAIGRVQQAEIRGAQRSLARKGRRSGRLDSIQGQYVRMLRVLPKLIRLQAICLAACLVLLLGAIGVVSLWHAMVG